MPRALRWVGVNVAFALALASCSGEPALLRQVHKDRAINEIRRHLLESVDAEKSAVLATTDEESQALAKESQRSAAEINRLRGELRELVSTDKLAPEIKALDEFDASWAELERIDKRLLALAVQNTNLKAARLTTREGAAALDRFIGALTDMQKGTDDPQTLRALARASVAALRQQSLLFLHIPSAEDAEMTRLEEQIRQLSGEVDQILAEAAQNDQVSAEQRIAAAQAWSEYRRISADVVRLSRENTNVISFDISIHEKRDATKRCLDALSGLTVAVNAGPHATR